MIGSFSHKLGNLKIKSALVFAILYFIFATGQKNYATATPDTLSVNSFDVTKNLLIMIVFAFLMIATSVSMIIKKNQRSKEINF
jgi:integral membrane sensor domain MASE1